MISYTSDKNGITIGVIGTSFADALAKLAEEFGEEVVAPYADARNELTTLVSEVEKADAASKAAELPPRVAVAQGSVDRRVDEPPFDDGSRLDDAGGDETAGGGTRSGGAGDADSFAAKLDSLAEGQPSGPATEVPARAAAQERQGPPKDVNRCVACGDPISDEMAKASMIIKGEYRCADDMA
jgi:hypothetical protein